MPTPCIRDHGRCHRCEAGHTFYVLDGKVTHIATQRGGPQPIDVPCATCDEQTFARSSDCRGYHRVCFNGHTTTVHPQTGELRRALTIEEMTKYFECLDCGATREVGDHRFNLGRCPKCAKAHDRAKVRVYRETHPCPCGEPTATTHHTFGATSTEPARVKRICTNGHKTYWSHGGTRFLRPVRGVVIA